MITTALISKIVMWIVGLSGSSVFLKSLNIPSKIVELLVHRIGQAKLQKLQSITELHKGVIEDAIRYAQERFQEFEGSAKYKMVSEVIQKEFERLKLPAIPEDQLEVLIHSMLKQVKGQFGEAWEKQVNATQPESEQAA